MLNRVLLVDDSKSARFALRKLLERSGLQVDVAESAEQALGYLDNHHPDLIFMDHFMPGMDGFEAAKAIKNLPDKSEIPIVMCTSKEGDEYAQEARQHGAIDILPKPATPGALTEVLDNLTRKLEEQKMQRQLSQAVEQPEIEEPAASGAEAIEQSKTELPKKVPTLDDVVVPVEQIRRFAAESATELVNQYTEQHVKEALESQLPELRKQVMSNFEKVAKLVLQEHLDNELARIKSELALELKPAETPPIEILDRIDQEEVEVIVEARTQQLYEKIQRELNEQLAEIYSSIGELKSNQHLKKVSPELMEDILSRAQDAAAERSHETLLEVSEIAQKTARQAAEEVSEQQAEQLKEEFQQRQAKAMESVLEAARQEASKSSWKEIEQLNLQLTGKLRKLHIISGLSLAAAGLSLLGVIFLMG